MVSCPIRKRANLKSKLGLVFRGARITRTKDLGNKNHGNKNHGCGHTRSSIIIRKIPSWISSAQRHWEKQGLRAVKNLQSPGVTSSAEGRNLAGAENTKPGSKCCSGTEFPTPPKPCRDQREAALKLTRHLLAFLEVERVFQYNKQRGHTQVMESFHIQAEQVPLSCFIYFFHSFLSKSHWAEMPSTGFILMSNILLV